MPGQVLTLTVAQGKKTDNRRCGAVQIKHDDARTEQPSGTCLLESTVPHLRPLARRIASPFSSPDDYLSLFCSTPSCTGCFNPQVIKLRAMIGTGSQVNGRQILERTLQMKKVSICLHRLRADALECLVNGGTREYHCSAALVSDCSFTAPHRTSHISNPAFQNPRPALAMDSRATDPRPHCPATADSADEKVCKVPKYQTSLASHITYLDALFPAGHIGPNCRDV